MFISILALAFIQPFGGAGLSSTAFFCGCFIYHTPAFSHIRAQLFRRFIVSQSGGLTSPRSFSISMPLGEQFFCMFTPCQRIGFKTTWSSTVFFLLHLLLLGDLFEEDNYSISHTSLIASSDVMLCLGWWWRLCDHFEWSKTAQLHEYLGPTGHISFSTSSWHPQNEMQGLIWRKGTLINPRISNPKSVFPTPSISKRNTLINTPNISVSFTYFHIFLRSFPRLGLAGWSFFLFFPKKASTWNMHSFCKERAHFWVTITWLKPADTHPYQPLWIWGVVLVAVLP